MYVDYKEVGKRIAARRKFLGLKQSHVNEMAGLSDKYLSNIETARSIPSIDVLMRICKALDTTPDYILLGATKNDDDLQTDKLALEKLKSFSGKKKKLVYRFIDMADEMEI